MRRKSREEWSAHIRAQELSGEPIVDYCRAQGLSPKSFSYWRSQLKSIEEPRFVSLGGSSSGFQIEFHHRSGLVVKVPVMSEVSTLRKVLEVLGC